MKKYDDEMNAKGIYIIFTVVQMILLAMMYTIVYVSYRATEISIEKYGLNAITAYAPTLIVFVAVPVLFFRTRTIFRQGSMMIAVTWMMAILSLLLVGLILHVMNISGVS